MDWQIIVAVLLVVVGIAGTVLPMLPGVPLVFAGLLLAAWHSGFNQVGIITMVIIGAIAAMAWAVDFFASVVTAKKAGASKYALWGAAIGAVVGIIGGIPGLIIGPAIGAIIGELITHKDTTKATTVGIAAGLGFVLALAIKIVLVLTMLAVFAYAYYN
ncbi:MAG TPA: DUF456 domain-containing protein [Methylotenera sp.]|nr:DUF456 domain-containing protein [Methylotenera sp.]